MAGQQSERQIVEEYLKHHCIQDCLDEVINELVESRPSNPYVAITRMMETKTLAEISEILLSSTIVGRGSSGIQATIITNIGSFSATVAYPYSTCSQYDLSTDYTSIQETLKENLCKLDPRDISEIDRALESVTDLESTVSLAVSMACCRAGARHKGMSLYRFLNAALGDGIKMGGPVPLKIPLPVVAMISRAKLEEGEPKSFPCSPCKFIIIQCT